MTAREEFEDWAGRWGWGRTLDRDEDGDYADKCTQLVWDAWQVQQSEINDLRAEVEHLKDRLSTE